MTTTTARHKLPLIVPGQAQKEMFHNESLSAIDALLHAAVESVGSNTPPAAPEEGRSWIIGAASEGAWAGQARAVASWTAGGWRFQAPVEGLSVRVRPDGLRAEWDGSAWRVGDVAAARLVVDGKQVVGARGPAIPEPSGGTTVDEQARSGLAAVLAALRAHGLVA